MGVIIVKDGKILFGQRLNAHGAGSWSIPGGHLECNETWEDCAKRETKEETELEIANPRFVAVTNDIFKKENKHYVTIYMQADWLSGKLEVLEPDKMVKWQWCTWDRLPQPLFLPLKNLVESGFSPSL